MLGMLITSIIMMIIGGGIGRGNGYGAGKICPESSEQKEISIDVDAGTGREVFAQVTLRKQVREKGR
jgi:hypothetical protein